MRGSSGIAQRPSVAPRPPTSFHCWAAPTPPSCWSHLPGPWRKSRSGHPGFPTLQLPGFLIDGDYYIIDLLGRTVPALGTLCPLLEACRRTWHLPPKACFPALPAPPAPPPSRGGRPQSHLPWWPRGRVLGWGGRQAGESRRRPAGLRVGLWSVALPAPL